MNAAGAALAVEAPAPVDGVGPVLAVLGLHLLLALAAPLVARSLGRRVFLVVAVAPAAALVWAATAASAIFDGQPATERLGWAPDLGFDVVIRVDPFSLLMLLLVSGIGVLVFAYANSYFSDRPDIGRMAGLLVGFSGAMLGLVLADNLLAIFLFWEMTSITSYLLIGIDDRSSVARAAALRALLTTAAGGLAMFAGFILLAQQSGTWSLSGLLANPPSGTVVSVALVLVLLGAFTKSAQVPFQFWLPGAMAAPTPVSAYLHSATMVKAGVYLIARFAPAFAEAPVWRPLVITVGLATMLWGGWRALSQHDLKLLLAHGTTSQLGFLVVLLGAGFANASLAGALLLLAHAAFKAALFMVVGIIDHQTGTRDIRRLDGLHRPLRATFVVAVVAAGSMAGLPPLLGFVAKEAAYEAFLGDQLGGFGPIVLAGLVVGSMLTFAYSLRAVWGGFASKSPADRPGDPPPKPATPPSVAFLAPAALLAVVTLVLGILPRGVADVVIGGAKALDPLVALDYLSLWHGFNTALLLSVLTVAGGLVLWWQRRGIARLQRLVRLLPSGARSFDWLQNRVLHTADVVTGRVQSGSLPVYLLIILATVLLVPGVLLVLAIEEPGELLVFDRPMQVPVAGLLVIATIGAVRAMHRMAAVLAVGAVGYGVAILFVIQGAPDLALTQLLIETLVLVVYVLVMRHLPRRFAVRQTAVPRAPRVVLSVLVGVFFACFAVVAFSARPDIAPVSDEIVARALPDADGRNVVNVILVDIRGFDTFGEIVVLTVAGLGVIGLVRAARRERVRTRTTLARVRYRRSPILDTALQMLLRTVLVFSVALLLVGHDNPGGGFIGGLVAGAGLMIVYLAGGDLQLRRTEPISPEVFLGVGISIAAVAGAAGWWIAGDFLAGGSWSLALPAVGELKLSTALAFDLGVYLVVIGLVLSLLRSLGREEVQAL